MLTIQSASNPYYSDDTGLAIHLIVKFAEYEEAFGFCAMPNDSMSYGVELYNRAKTGEFGEIAPYSPPPPAPNQPQTTGSQTL
jgi:hypothetical protein